jgi:hypothetical protein
MARMGYFATLDWVVRNDDTNFLDDDEPIPSVTICLIADIFDKEIEDVIAALRRRMKRRDRSGLGIQRIS